MLKRIMALGLAAILMSACALAQEGPLRYSVQDEEGQEIKVVQFSGELPEELLLEHPKLEGWTVLCGAYDDRAAENDRQYEAGLMIFEKQNQRQLVLLTREADESQWQISPVGEHSVRQGQAVYITCDPPNRVFNIVYPLSAAEDECFQVGVDYGGKENTTGCQLRGYSRMNRLTGAGIQVEMGYDKVKITTTDEAGATQKCELERKMHSDFARVDVDIFPTTLEAWEQLPRLQPPKGYGVTVGVHLRAQTSSRSKDLGKYKAGTLVEILGAEDGDPYNWYHVRIGRMEGYMCSVYVDYPGSVCNMQPLMQREALPVAQTLKAVKLRSGIGLLAQTVQEIPAGTMMHVLAERGDWLHVMIPQGEISWMMDVDGIDGYVRARDVRQGVSAQQLEWTE